MCLCVCLYNSICMCICLYLSICLSICVYCVCLPICIRICLSVSHWQVSGAVFAEHGRGLLSQRDDNLHPQLPPVVLLVWVAHQLPNRGGGGDAQVTRRGHLGVRCCQVRVAHQLWDRGGRTGHSEGSPRGPVLPGSGHLSAAEQGGGGGRTGHSEGSPRGPVLPGSGHHQLWDRGDTQVTRRGGWQSCRSAAVRYRVLT